MIKSPNYQIFVQFLFDESIIDWNPAEHDDWELPPSECLKWFWDLFPLDKESEVVDFINKTTRKIILNYFNQKGEIYQWKIILVS
ncbi:hypothetical protein CWR48_15565 [Oceanobacillus arenosus]|uniref:Uncharacterized protein n=1 Tax=Oceanobacillus arenosus TaxID=1229153 RepID=A0A3D8PLQ9_9BACI|nr:hypothetical protein [Oceanobacillus arenosus]RDW17020.1 hypothetical protein CWR48_15565 [Oceanobacillus arenosus]